MKLPRLAPGAVLRANRPRPPRIRPPPDPPPEPVPDGPSCPDCGGRQFKTPSGLACDKGHGYPDPDFVEPLPARREDPLDGIRQFDGVDESDQRAGRAGYGSRDVRAFDGRRGLPGLHEFLIRDPGGLADSRRHAHGSGERIRYGDE